MFTALKKGIAILTMLCLLAVILVARPERLMSAQAFIQGATGKQSTFASTVNATFGSALTNGSIIVVAVAMDANTTKANTPTDTALNVYVKATSTSVGVHIGTNVEVWYAQNTHTTASNKVTVTDNGGGVNSIVVIQEFTGQAAGTPVDGIASAQDATAGTAINSGNTATLAQATEEVICVGLTNLGSNSLVLGSGYTNLNQDFDTSPNNLGMSSKSVSATTAVSCVMTTTSADWVGVAVTIKDLVAGGSTPLSDDGQWFLLFN